MGGSSNFKSISRYYTSVCLLFLACRLWLSDVKPHFLHDVWSLYIFIHSLSTCSCKPLVGVFTNYKSHDTKNNTFSWMRSFQEALGGWEADPFVLSLDGLLHLRSGPVRREFTVKGQKEKTESHQALCRDIEWGRAHSHQGPIRDMEQCHWWDHGTPSTEPLKESVIMGDGP